MLPHGPPSRCLPHQATIATQVRAGLSVRRIWQDLVTDHGLAGGYDSVWRFCQKRWKSSRCQASRDFQTGAEALSTGHMTSRELSEVARLLEQSGISNVHRYRLFHEP